MNLREFGLLNYHSKNNKRIWTPTLLGFFVGCYISLYNCYPNIVIGSYNLSHLNSIQYYLIDDRIKEVLIKLRSKETFDDLISKLEFDIVKFPSIERFHKLLVEYSNSITKNIKNFEYKVITKQQFHFRLKQIVKITESDSNIEILRKEIFESTNSEVIMNRVRNIINPQI